MNISPNFTLEEATFSDMALRKGISNQPDKAQMDAILKAAEGMEIIRSLLHAPVHINSWLRVPFLNAMVGGAKNSAHMQGYAIDFICKEFGTPLDIVNKLIDADLEFDQLIQEGTWVHVSFDPAMRKEVLTAHFGASGTTYTKGT